MKNSKRFGSFTWAIVAGGLAAVGYIGHADAGNVAEALARSGVRERLGAQVSLDVALTDSAHHAAKLADYFDGSTPVLLTLNYFHCVTLCDLQLERLALRLRELADGTRAKVRVLSVSIDPHDTPEIAAVRRSVFVRHAGPAADWNFFVTSDVAAHALARSVGLTYGYDSASNQYAHIPVVFFLSAHGRVLRYLYGIELDPSDFRWAVLEASAGRVGDSVDKVLLNCFRYDAASGKYSVYVLGVVRVAGALTLLAMGLCFAVLRRRERQRSSDREGSG